MGRVCHSDFHGLQPVAPSAIAAEGNAWCHNKIKKPYEVPRALETEEIATVVDEYRKAAQCASSAGFDGVEIHAANGYLIDQFLQSTTNTRTDEYGGSMENRFKFLKQVLEAVGTVFPYNRIAIRLSPNGSFGSMGSPDNHEAFSFYIEQLNSYGLSFLHLVDGLAFGFHNKCPVFRAFHARSLFNNPIVGNCGYTKESAEGAINTGCLDAIAFGRITLANPDLVARFRNNWPLAPTPPYPLWYEAPGDNAEDPETQAEGYCDFPSYSPSPAEI
jgi:N-ethylmaleimide reductase